MVLLTVLVSSHAFAQLEVGDAKMNLSGNLGFGYSGAYGTEDSTHGQSIMGNAYLSGSYYHPNFLSFRVRPYYDRNQSNSASQVTAHDNGIDLGADIFSGSYFPGSVSFGKQFNSTGEFGLPGVSGLITHGSGQTFQVNWAEVVPGLPPLFASFSDQSSDYTAIGTTGQNKTNSKLFTLNSNYQWAGFGLNGNFSHLNQAYDFPDYLGLVGSYTGSSTNYGATAQHALPMHGNLSLGWNHSIYDNQRDTNESSSSTSTSAGIGFVPWSRFQISSNVNYTTNLFAGFKQAFGNSGLFEMVNSSQNSNSLQFNSNATFIIARGLTANGHFTQTTASFLGRDYSNTQYGGTLNYHFAHRLLGMFFFSGGVIDNASQQGNNGIGMVGNAGFNRKFGHWETSADFGYSQDVQTLYGIGTTSTITYGGSVRRKLNPDTFWGGSFRATHTGLVQIEGEGSGSESVSSSLSWKRYTGTVTYAQSRGTSILTSAGLLNPTPVVPILTNDFVLYNGRSLGVSGGLVLFRRMNVGVNYAKAHSATNSLLAHSLTDAQLYNVRAEYKVRKLSFIGGFTRIDQGLNTQNNGLPTVVNSFYLSISRWFNVF